ncbi:MAG TPA: hypothetical protein VG826_32460 [Pirellulales bacterium]|nr:hypothetical protein [Pirellulales bacterium]
MGQFFQQRKWGVAVAVAAFWLFGIAGQSQAGVILLTQPSSMQQTSLDGCGPCDNHDVHDDDVAAEHNELPLSNGASGGGSSINIRAVGVIERPCDVFSQAAPCSRLEERRLSLPDSPVSDRLRPPQVS